MTHSVAKIPCGSCPYRCDVPSGLWHRDEYENLPGYDGQTWEQSPNLFLCHQRDGNLCAGWLACHDPRELLALRLHAREVNPAVFAYETDTPVFKSGADAARHGMREVAAPGPRASRMIAGLNRKLEGA